jgi:hypothetical protein
LAAIGGYIHVAGGDISRAARRGRYALMYVRGGANVLELDVINDIMDARNPFYQVCCSAPLVVPINRAIQCQVSVSDGSLHCFGH